MTPVGVFALANVGRGANASTECVRALVIPPEREEARFRAFKVKGDVVEYDALHWVGFVAKDDPGREPRRRDVDVSHRNVGKCDASLSWAPLYNRVLQRAIAAVLFRASGLLLLLRSNPDRPPFWLNYADILVDDVCNLTRAAWFAVWVAFNVDPFPSPRHCDVLEGYVAYAVVVRIRWHRTNACAKAGQDCIFNQHVLRARALVILRMAWLDGDGVVVIVDAAVVNPDVMPA